MITITKWKIDDAEDLPLAVIENTENGDGVAEIGTVDSVSTAKQMENARLIAASPELLQFAEDILRYVKAGTIETSSDRNFVMMRAKEVISLAKGK